MVIKIMILVSHYYQRFHLLPPWFVLPLTRFCEHSPSYGIIMCDTGHIRTKQWEDVFKGAEDENYCLKNVSLVHLA